MIRICFYFQATAYIFTDMQTPDRHGHALECYTVTSKRCGALLQWIHQVRTVKVPPAKCK